MCNRSVRFILERDPGGYFQFAALQSEAGRRLLAEQGAEALGERLESVLLIENGRLYSHSTAALRIVRRLKGAWRLLYGFVLIPPFLRNAVYRWVARNRYRWFGKQEACALPRPEWRGRFLGD